MTFEVQLPHSLAANPRACTWLAFETSPDRVVVRVGKVEIGQGIGTALVQIAADALGLSPAQIRLVAGVTGASPDELWTSASISVEVGGASVAWVCGAVRTRFTAIAAERLGADVRSLDVIEGRFFVDSIASTETYWSLADSVDLDFDAARVPRPPSSVRRLVGEPLERLDLVDKLRGNGFIHDLRVPGMLHARIVRPRLKGMRATFIDGAAIRNLRGVLHLHVDGSFIAIVARDEHDAVRAQSRAEELIEWTGGCPLPTQATLEDLVRSLPIDETRQTHRAGPVEQTCEPEATRRATYIRPFLAHASIGTCCALAVPEGAKLTVYSHSQGVYPLRSALAVALGMSADDVQVVHRDGAGCYGHNGADDVALDAALLARACGAPVRVAWSRNEELTCAPFGPAMLVDICASVAPDGRVTRWRQETISNTHLARPGWGEGVNLLAASQLAAPQAHAPIADVPLEPFGGGGERNAVPIYGFCDSSIRYRFSANGPLRTSALRSLGAHANVFAIESMMDELASEVELDPFEMRRLNLRDERALAVLETACAMSNWTPSRRGTGDRGWGMAMSRYKNRAAWFAAVVEVELTHVVRVVRVSAAVDCGLAVNPDGVRNQVEGGIVQAISWTLKEQVTWNEAEVTSCDWQSYPVLNFDEVPEIDIEIMGRPAAPPLGVGECTMGPISAAIANAVSNALGVRIREMPITAQAISVALSAT